jgi:hypothetical protein
VGIAAPRTSLDHHLSVPPPRLGLPLGRRCDTVRQTHIEVYPDRGPLPAYLASPDGEEVSSRSSTGTSPQLPDNACG